ncbi:hypothetical protein RYH73_01315 [Olivibacter sp. CPCC 100613]|uniref:hypothetical protein n=1 Tax=Olivibacter sp. CPCC 100613 TaxID=3079931 RepID=UPI002FF98215
MTKYKAKISPHENADEFFIWRIRALQFADPKKWSGKDYYYCHPPYYKMKAVTNVTKKIIHFSFNDSSVPNYLKKGGKGFCHQYAQDFISKERRLRVRYKNKNFTVEFVSLEEESRILIEEGKYLYADLKGKIKSPEWFVTDIGSDELVVEIYHSNKSTIEKQAGYRKTDNAAIQIELNKCYAFKNEKHFHGYSEEQIVGQMQILESFISRSYFQFDILHFPTQKRQRFQESKITKKAKDQYNGSRETTSLAAPLFTQQEHLEKQAPVFISQDIKQTTKKNKESTFSQILSKFKRFFQKR